MVKMLKLKKKGVHNQRKKYKKLMMSTSKN